MNQPAVCVNGTLTAAAGSEHTVANAATAKATRVGFLTKSFIAFIVISSTVFKIDENARSSYVDSPSTSVRQFSLSLSIQSSCSAAKIRATDARKKEFRRHIARAAMPVA
jgi:hypothetical protein